MQESALDIDNLWAVYPGAENPVLRGINLEVKKGEIFAIIGENGAGKSSLARMLLGELHILQGAWASQVPFELVPQHPSGFRTITVAELLTMKGARPQELPIQLEGISPRACLSDLNLSQLHMVYLFASVAALYSGNGVLFLDESTAPLSPREVQWHYDLLSFFTQRGGSVLIVGHRLEELRTHCHRLGIMQNGVFTETIETLSQVTSTDLTEKMFTHTTLDELIPSFNPLSRDRPVQERNAPKTPIISLESISISPGGIEQTNETGLEDISLDLLSGEILVILGLKDQGIELLEEVLCGLREPDTGRLRFPTDSTFPSKGFLPSRGFGFLPHDRLKRGIVGGMQVWENRILHRRGSLALKDWFFPRAYLDSSQDIDYPGDFNQSVGTLSGGMIQRLLIQRETDAAQQGMILSEPSWGLDPRYRTSLYNHLNQSVQNGTGILLLTSDIDEALILAHRLVVIYGGRIVKNFGSSLPSRNLGIEAMMGLV